MDLYEIADNICKLLEEEYRAYNKNIVVRHANGEHLVRLFMEKLRTQDPKYVMNELKKYVDELPKIVTVPYKRFFEKTDKIVLYPFRYKGSTTEYIQIEAYCELEEEDIREKDILSLLCNLSAEDTGISFEVYTIDRNYKIEVQYKPFGKIDLFEKDFVFEKSPTQYTIVVKSSSIDQVDQLYTAHVPEEEINIFFRDLLKQYDIDVSTLRIRTVSRKVNL